MHGPVARTCHPRVLPFLAGRRPGQGIQACAPRCAHDRRSRLPGRGAASHPGRFKQRPCHQRPMRAHPCAAEGRPAGVPCRAGEARAGDTPTWCRGVPCRGAAWPRGWRRRTVLGRGVACSAACALCV